MAWIRNSAFEAFLLAAALSSAAAGASEISVQTANPNSGAHAARVTIASDCASPNHATLSGNSTGGTFEGCTTLSADVDVASGANRFRAGDAIALGDGFSVAAGASLTLEIDPALFPDAFLADDTLAGLTLLSARFYLDADALTLGAAETVYALAALGASGEPWFRVGLTWNPMGGGERRVFVEAREAGGTVRTTRGATELLLPAGWHWLEVGWTAASSPGANDGAIYLCLDDLAAGCAGFADLDNSAGAVETIHWGAKEVPTGDFGHLDLDDFQAREGLFIGPVL